MPESNILFTVCARNGSKGVVNKNVRELKGKPLIQYTLEFLEKCSFKTHTVVSTDGDPIESVVKDKVDFVHRRCAELAGDETPRWPVLVDVVKAAEKKFNISYDYVFDFLGTAPLRTMKDMHVCYEMVCQKGVDNVVTAVPSHRNPYFNMLQMDGSNAYPQVVCNIDGEITRRQDAPETYDMNGSIYAFKKEALLKSPNLFTKNTRLHIMSELTGVDVDTEADFEFLEFLLDKHGTIE
jgi:CMP-N,N'-diacetyllegionaminic acid synthase